MKDGHYWINIFPDTGWVEGLTIGQLDDGFWLVVGCEEIIGESCFEVVSDVFKEPIKITKEDGTVGWLAFGSVSFTTL